MTDTEFEIICEFIKKINQYILPPTARAELEEIQSYINSKQGKKESALVILSHITGFLHYQNITLSYASHFIEPLIQEADRLMQLLTPKEANIISNENIDLTSTTEQIDILITFKDATSTENNSLTTSKLRNNTEITADDLDPAKTRQVYKLTNEQKRLDKNIKFTQFLRKIRLYALQHGKSAKKIFMSYAWPIQNKYGEKWTKEFNKRLTAHLCRAGLQVFLDEFHSSGGYPLRKFMQNIGNMDHVIVINTKTMKEKLSLENSGVIYEATQIKKHLEYKDTNKFIINIVFDDELYCDPVFKKYPKQFFLSKNEDAKYNEALCQLIADMYGFTEKHELDQFKNFYHDEYEKYKIDADLWHVENPSQLHIKREISKDFLSSCDKCSILILYGLSGTGKSELVRDYVWENYAKYQSVYWFDASNLKSLENDYIQLMKEKNQIINQFNFSEFPALISKEVNSLIIIDNWQIKDESCYKQLIACNTQEKSKILVTTSHEPIQFKNLYTNTAKQISTFAMPVYTHLEARTFIQMILGEQSEQDIFALIQAIGLLPDKLALTCGHIQRQSRSIQRFLNQYRNPQIGEKIFIRPLLPIPKLEKNINAESTMERKESIEINAHEDMLPNSLDMFLCCKIERLSEIGKEVQQILKLLYERFKCYDYDSNPILLSILNNKEMIKSFSTSPLKDDLLIENLNFIISHINAIVHQLDEINLSDLLPQAKIIITNYHVKSRSLKTQNQSANTEDISKPPIVQEVTDDITQEWHKFQEQEKLDQLTNTERSLYERSFKSFLEDIWQFALTNKCPSKKIYLFYAVSSGNDDDRWWMQSYVENLKNHLRNAGFTVYPDKIQQELADDEKLLSEMDHVIAVSTPLMTERLKNIASKEKQFSNLIIKIADTKPLRFVIPLLTGKINHLSKEWRELAEFTLFKNKYYVELGSLIQILYKLDHIGTFNNYYKQRLLFHRIIDNRWHQDGKFPSKPEHFIGRVEQLEKIKQIFDKEGHQVAVVTAAGMGGVGKTSLILQYIHLYGHEYQKIYWIDATSEETIKAAYVQLAHDMHIVRSLEERNSNDILAERIKRILEQKSSWLIVYDNATNRETLKNLLPNQGGKILITSRNIVWSNAISVEIFKLEEAKKYIFVTLGDEILRNEPDIEKAIANLIRITGKLPLALSLVCSYIKKSNENKLNKTTIHQYVDLYEKNIIESTKNAKSDLQAIEGFDYNIAIICSLTIHKMEEESPEARLLLYYSAFLHHNFIPIDLISYYFPNIRNNKLEILIDNALRAAKEYSLINIDDQCLTFSMHSLVQQTIRNQLIIAGNDGKILVKGVFAFDKYYPYGPDYDQMNDYILKKTLKPHLEETLKFFELYINKKCDHIEDHTIIDESKMNLLLTLLIYLADANDALSDALKSKLLYNQILTYQKHLYKNIFHINIVITLRNLSRVYETLGCRDLQYKFLEDALFIIEKYYCTDYVELYAITLQNMALIYGDLGDYEQQKRLLEKAIELLVKNNGKNYLIAYFQMDLGVAYSHLGDIRKQKEICEQAFPILESHYGKKHIKVAIALNNIANTYGYYGYYNIKRQLLERALQIQENYYGNEHILIARTLNNLGNAYFNLGHIIKSKEILERSLYLHEANYGNSHMETARALRCLADVYVSLKDINKAQKLLDRALAINKKHYGDIHVVVADTLIDLSRTYLSTGLSQDGLEQACMALKQARKIKKRLYGKKHIQTAIIYAKLCMVHAKMGNLLAAKKLLNEAKSLDTSLLNDDTDIERLKQEIGQAELEILIKKYNLPDFSQASLEKGLRNAAPHNNIDDIEAFIKLGCNVNAQDGTYKRTALHNAVMKNAIAAVHKLLPLGAQFDIKDAEELTAYDYTKNNIQIRSLFDRRHIKSLASNNNIKTAGNYNPTLFLKQNLGIPLIVLNRNEVTILQFIIQKAKISIDTAQNKNMVQLAFGNQTLMQQCIDELHYIGISKLDMSDKQRNHSDIFGMDDKDNVYVINLTIDEFNTVMGSNDAYSKLESESNALHPPTYKA